MNFEEFKIKLTSFNLGEELSEAEIIEIEKLVTNDKRSMDFFMAQEKVFAALNSDSIKIKNLAGLNYFKLGRFEDSKKVFEGLYKKHPEEPVVLNNLAMNHYMLGDLDNASSLLKRAIMLFPQYAEAYNSLGLVSFAQGDQDKGYDYFYKACDLDRANGIFFANLAIATYKKGDIVRATKFASKAYDFAPGNEDIKGIYNAIVENLNADKIDFIGSLAKAA